MLELNNIKKMLDLNNIKKMLDLNNIKKMLDLNNTKIEHFNEEGGLWFFVFILFMMAPLLGVVALLFIPFGFTYINKINSQITIDYKNLYLIFVYFLLIGSIIVSLFFVYAIGETIFSKKQQLPPQEGVDPTEGKKQTTQARVAPK